MTAVRFPASIAALAAAFASMSVFSAPQKPGNPAQNDPDAILDLLNSRAAGNETRYEAAALKVAEGARRGLPLQMFIIALSSRNGDRLPPGAAVDAETQEAYFKASRPVLERIAARKSNPIVLYLLAMESHDAAMLEKAAELGNPQALNRTAAGLVADNPARYPDSVTNAALVKAFGRFKAAAKQNDMNGCYNFGVCLNSGIGTERDEEAAFNAFRTAAERGHVDAMNNLGICFREGIHVRPDIEASAYWFRKASEAGSPTGMLNYGWALKNGEGVPQNRKKAQYLIYKAAKAGHPDALNAWGLMLLRGDCVGKEPVAAFKAFEAAALLGNATAMDNLYACYRDGIGVEKSASKALYWKMKSDAANGDAVAAAWVKDEEKKLAKEKKE